MFPSRCGVWSSAGSWDTRDRRRMNDHAGEDWENSGGIRDVHRHASYVSVNVHRGLAE